MFRAQLARSRAALVQSEVEARGLERKISFGYVLAGTIAVVADAARESALRSRLVCDAASARAQVATRFVCWFVERECFPAVERERDAAKASAALARTPQLLAVRSVEQNRQ